MKNKPKQNYLLYGVITLFSLTLLISLLLFPVKIAGSCELDGIELVDLTENIDINESVECWNTDFSAKHCPIPKKIKCDADIRMPFIYLQASLGGL